MKGKILFAAGMGVGYVLGTRAGRARYDELKRAADSFWNSPRVKYRVDQVEDFVKEKAPEVAEFVSDGAKKFVSQVTGTSTKKPAATSTKSSNSAAKKSAANSPVASSGSSS